MKRIWIHLILLLSISLYANSQQLSVEKIMRDPKWMGTFPADVQWDDKGHTIYFRYNPEKNPADSLYKINLQNPSNIQKVSIAEQKSLTPRNARFNNGRTKKVYSQNGDLFVVDLVTGAKTNILSWGERIGNPTFLAKENRISFESGNNLYVVDIQSGRLQKITRIQSGPRPSDRGDDKAAERERWLKEDNLSLLSVVNERDQKVAKSKAYQEAIRDKEPFVLYTGSKAISNLQLSPDENFATILLFSRAENKSTIVPDYVDASGYTVNLPTRSKVGDNPPTLELAVYDLKKDTAYMVGIGDLPGITDLPNYVKDYPEKTWEPKERKVTFGVPVFSPNGKYAVVNIRAIDNKDRWISLIDLVSGKLVSLDRQRDEAWVAGPGIGGFGGGTLGWLPDSKHVYFQSEETGYSHLYILNVETGEKKALTSGKFEVFDPFISKNGKHWYLTTSEVHPGERHFYIMPLMGGKLEKITTLNGNNVVSLSPDEKNLAILYSYSNKPWELYLQANAPKSQPKQLTSGQSEEFRAYPWRDPSLVSFKAADGADVPARLYSPDPAKKNGAAVIFVHGAGYLQNVHKWWSSYFREYMFHNLLTDLGYTVLDIDYRGSAGYGRDWRTGIYRHMGGKDLSDQVDGAKFLVQSQGVNPSKIGIYGGSYGGFITLMALFNASDTFAAGAALRSVTDWAHYNHGYTANILNEPFNDPIAYRRSSPIYFAEGLKGNLLIAHGMVDVNVHFQDVVRLAQRLIELEKDNWEMAVYPVEDHGFVEPSSWTDEYKRILKLFNETLLK